MNFLWRLNARRDHVPKLIALSGEDIFAEFFAATIGGLDRVADGVGEGLLHHVVPVGSRLGCSVSKRATKAMDRYIALLHLLQHLWHGHVAKAGSRAGADENM